jgi:hypothetical protein
LVFAGSNESLPRYRIARCNFGPIEPADCVSSQELFEKQIYRRVQAGITMSLKPDHFLARTVYNAAFQYQNAIRR